MRRVAGLLLALVGAAVWADPEDPADLYQEPRFEVGAGLALGSDNQSAAVFGPSILGAVYLSDHWGVEGWFVPAGLKVETRGNQALDDELGPLTAFYRHWGAGLVSRWRLDFVSPSILNVLVSAGWHQASFDGVSTGDPVGSWYASAGAQLILGRPFVLGARVRWMAWSDRWIVQGTGTLGLAF
jgi:hypothetical protein